MIKKFRLTPVADRLAEWDDLVRGSAQGTVFSLSHYLLSIGRPFLLLFVFKGNEIKAGVALNTSEDGKRAVLDDFVIYNGIIFRADSLQKAVKARLEQFEIAEFVLAELEQRFQAIEMALHPSYEDLRPILWRNYDDPDQSRRYKVDVRYTSHLDISEFFLRRNEESMALYGNLDNIRQSDIRKARKELASVAEDRCTGMFIKFYSMLMESQQMPVSQDVQDRMHALIEALLTSGLGRLFVVRDKSGQITYITIFTIFENHACYLFGAGDTHSMARYDGTICLWDSFKMLAAQGIREVDLEGVNSPLRGAFKLSFGGDIRPYFHIGWNGTRNAGNGDGDDGEQ